MFTPRRRGSVEALVAAVRRVEVGGEAGLGRKEQESTRGRAFVVHQEGLKLDHELNDGQSDHRYCRCAEARP